MAKPFTIKFKCVSDGYLHKMSPDDRGGGGAFRSWGAFIMKGDREYLSAVGYVEQLNAGNTTLQNRRIRAYASSGMVVEFDVEPKDFPIPEKARFICDALNAAIDETGKSV